MRIAFANWTNRMVGGAETYISAIAPYLRNRGHEIALWYESDHPADRKKIVPEAFSKSYCLDLYGLTDWAHLLSDWEPDVIFSQGLYHPEQEEALLGIAPAVFFAHNYHATCISGTKSHHFPAMRACSHRFGPTCLAQFYPRRCGGLNPATMIADYKRTKNRAEVLRRFDQVLTHSHHMEQEYCRNGINCRAIPFFVQPGQSASTPEFPDAGDEWQLLVMGRMTDLKGGCLLLKALPIVAEALNKPIKARFVGDGPARDQWQQEGQQIQERHRLVKAEFTGWLSGDPLIQASSDIHLHVLPSVWPEPYGLSGVELGLRGIPTVAFRVGGIPDWLMDGVNGILAEYQSPLVRSLADGIIRALRNRQVYRQLCVGAYQTAGAMSIQTHYEWLIDAFGSIRTSNTAKTIPA